MPGFGFTGGTDYRFFGLAIVCANLQPHELQLNWSSGRGLEAVCPHRGHFIVHTVLLRRSLFLWQAPGKLRHFKLQNGTVCARYN